MEGRIAELLARPDVAKARAWIEEHDAATLRWQRIIAEIASPTGAEWTRAAYLTERFEALGLHGIRTDEAGNVVGWHGPATGAAMVICSHLDTVFPAETPLAVTETNGRMAGPGIGDNARGLAALLALAEALVCCQVELPRPVAFVASVGEEGMGDLRGVKHLFGSGATFVTRPAGFIALDGPGLDRLVHRALGSRRLRATYTGPGGHSWAAFGVPNPAHAVGMATAQIAEIPLPAAPRSALSVVRIGGGQSLNTIPTEAWLELDLRSESEVSLGQLYEAATGALKRVVDLVNRRRSSGTAPLALDLVSLGERPSGTTEERHPLVQAAIAATKAMGGNPTLAAASTDANIPISRGVPGIALGAGGRGGDAHLTTEWYENDNGTAGIVRALLVVLAL